MFELTTARLVLRHIVAEDTALVYALSAPYRAVFLRSVIGNVRAYSRNDVVAFRSGDIARLLIGVQAAPQRAGLMRSFDAGFRPHLRGTDYRTRSATISQ